MRSHRCLVVFPVLLLAFALARAQTEVTCHIKPFNTVPGPTLRSEGSARSINRWGNIVGEDAMGRAYVRFVDGRIQLLPIPVPRIQLVEATKRNAFGVTVGWLESLSPTRVAELHGFVNTPGVGTRILDIPLVGINRYGTMLGRDASSEGIVVIRGGKVTHVAIPFEFSRDVELRAISDTGVIVGNYGLQNSPPDPDQTMHGFVVIKGMFQDFAFPDPAENTFITDINASGMIVGVLDGPHAIDSFIFKNGRFFRPRFILPNGTVAGRSVFIFGVNGFGAITGTFLFGQTAGPFVGSCDL